MGLLGPMGLKGLMGLMGPMGSMAPRGPVGPIGTMNPMPAEILILETGILLRINQYITLLIIFYGLGGIFTRTLILTLLVRAAEIYIRGKFV